MSEADSAGDGATEIGTARRVEDLGTVRYEVAGRVAWAVLNRPEKRNAQNSALIDDLDRAFDLADADDEVRVVVIAAAGDHFSAGHDLSGVVDPDAADEWERIRDTAEGKLRHEQVMFFDRCVRIRDFRKPTVAAVQGACVAAGLMLASMCDLVVAADDAFFANPVLKMSGAGVELLVEPYELGFRKAKEFLFTGMRLPAAEAQRAGLVNRVVARDELETAVGELADEIAKVPPVTAEMVKRSLNDAQDLAGQRMAWRNHFMIHQFTSNTETALGLVQQRQESGSMKAVMEQRDRGDE